MMFTEAEIVRSCNDRYSRHITQDFSTCVIEEVIRFGPHHAHGRSRNRGGTEPCFERVRLGVYTAPDQALKFDPTELVQEVLSFA